MGFGVIRIKVSRCVSSHTHSTLTEQYLASCFDHDDFCLYFNAPPPSPPDHTCLSLHWYGYGDVQSFLRLRLSFRDG